MSTVLLAGAAGCGDDEARMFRATTPLVWVDPARCLTPCTHTVEPYLVAVDSSARLASDGAFQLRAEAQPALAALIADAATASITITISSAHRTYEEQAALWDQYSVTEPGRSARPGHSEHEAGLAVDLGFVPDDGAAWTAANAWRYGFVLSYPEHKQKTTGLRYESWHFRFAGSEVAATLHASAGLTLEELFRMTPNLGVSGDCSDCPLDSSRSNCGTLTPAGQCSGDVLNFCFDGALVSIDCTAVGQVCGVDANERTTDCVSQ